MSELYLSISVTLCHTLIPWIDTVAYVLRGDYKYKKDLKAVGSFCYNTYMKEKEMVWWQLKFRIVFALRQIRCFVCCRTEERVCSTAIFQ